ncbi:MAG: hemerythrin domain-containing protein [Gammaproteobacteria bacterium]
MQKMLQTFHHEHAAMQRLVDQFDQEVELMRDDRSDPDYHLLLEMVRDFNGHKQHKHYREEEKLHYALRLSLPELTPVLERLENQQNEQNQLGNELEILLEAACGGHLVPRPKMLSVTEEFIRHLNDHIADEESQVIALAEQWVDERELSELDSG